MSLKTPVTDLLGIEHPIVLAPMAGVAGGALAAAVSRAGGLGLIGAGYGDGFDAELALAGDARVGAGFITWTLERSSRALDMALARRLPVVMLSFGDPTPFAARIKASGALLICQVESVAGAREALRAGADLIVAQGSEAGGHIAHRGAMALVPAVVDVVAPLPVLAAGGIADGRGLAAALALGAGGALVGTRFYASVEARGHVNAKARITEASGDETVRTTVFDTVRRLPWSSAYSARAIGNAFSARWNGRDQELAASLGSVDRDYQAAVVAGDVREAPVFAGECVDLIRDVQSAREIVEAIITQAEEAMERANRARRATRSAGP